MNVSAWNDIRARDVIAAHAGVEGAALPMLRALQVEFGCIPEQAIPLAADALNITRAEMHGIVTFYHDFRRTPPGRIVLKLCRAEACQSCGADALAAQAKDRLGIDWHGTTADGTITLEPVFCLGLCACAPSALAGDTPVGRLDAAALDALLDGLR